MVDFSILESSDSLAETLTFLVSSLAHVIERSLGHKPRSSQARLLGFSEANMKSIGHETYKLNCKYFPIGVLKT